MLIRWVFRNLAEDENGTAMTEFVITLPIFVLIFAFMASFHKYNVTLNRVRYRAATDMWREAMAVQDPSPQSPHGLPPNAMAQGQGIISGSGSFSADPQQQMLLGAMGSSESGRQMETGATMVGGSGSNPVDETSVDYAEDIARDGLTPLPLAQNGAVHVFDYAIPFTVGVTRHAGIIGTRYGMVEGTDTATADAGRWGSTVMSAQYDVMVSPVSMPADREPNVGAATRLLADQNECMGSVLSIHGMSLSDC